MSQLNEFQKRAIENVNGIKAIQAVPGSGKTHLIQALVYKLIHECHISPTRIVVFTFSRKAASELRRRIAKTLFGSTISEEDYRRLENPQWSEIVEREWLQGRIQSNPIYAFLLYNVSTLHSAAMRLLRNQITSTTTTSTTTTTNNTSSLSIMNETWTKQIQKQLTQHLLQWHVAEPVSSVLHWIQQAQLAMIHKRHSNDKIAQQQWFEQQLIAQGMPLPFNNNTKERDVKTTNINDRSLVVLRAKMLQQAFEKYLTFCRQHQLLDFTSMLVETLWNIQTNPTFREHVSSLYDYVIVDEAQDTDAMQAEIVWTLASKSRNLIFVGDVDQSMYSFRGAQPAVMCEWLDQYWAHPSNGSLHVQRFSLPINYRSTQNIVSAARRLIALHYQTAIRKPYEKTFDPSPTAIVGEPIAIHYASDIKSYTELFIDTLKTHQNNEKQNNHNNSKHWKRWFVLCRTRAECAEAHLQCIAHQIPAQNYSGGLLFELPHVKAVLCYAKLACNYENSRDNVDILGQVSNIATIRFKSPTTRRDHHCSKATSEKRRWNDYEDDEEATRTTSCDELLCPFIVRKGIDYSPTRHYGRSTIAKAGGTFARIVGHQFDCKITWLTSPITRKRQKIQVPLARALAARDMVEFIHRLETLSGNALICLQTIVRESVLSWYRFQCGARQMDSLSGQAESIEGIEDEFRVLYSMCEPHMSVRQFLEKVDQLSNSFKLLQDQKSDSNIDPDDHVRIGTFHWSKGAESDFVLVNATRSPLSNRNNNNNNTSTQSNSAISLPVGVVPLAPPPHCQSINENAADAALEEERRLFFVAITRARQYCVVLQSLEWQQTAIAKCQFISEMF